MHPPVVLNLERVEDDSVAMTECELATVYEGKSNPEDPLNIFSETKRKGKVNRPNVIQTVIFEG